MRKRNQKVPPTVREFRDVLTAARHLMAVLAPSDDRLAEVIKEVEGALAEHNSQPASEIVAAIRRHLGTTGGSVASSVRPTVEAISQSTPLETIKEWLAEPDASRERLMAIARDRFGIPTGRLAKLSIRGIRDEIEAAIRSIEGFDIIGRVASDDRRHGPVPDLGGVEKNSS